MQVGDLIRFTDHDADLGIGIITEQRHLGCYWVYFPSTGEVFSVTKGMKWEYICK